jgi:hypothetical protein
MLFRQKRSDDDAEGMIYLVADGRVKDGKHIRSKNRFQTVRTESAERHTEEGEKRTEKQ